MSESFITSTRFLRPCPHVLLKLDTQKGIEPNKPETPLSVTLVGISIWNHNHVIIIKILFQTENTVREIQIKGDIFQDLYQIIPLQTSLIDFPPSHFTPTSKRAITNINSNKSHIHIDWTTKGTLSQTKNNISINQKQSEHILIHKKKKIAFWNRPTWL